MLPLSAKLATYFSFAGMKSLCADMFCGVWEIESCPWDFIVSIPELRHSMLVSHGVLSWREGSSKCIPGPKEDLRRERNEVV